VPGKTLAAPSFKVRMTAVIALAENTAAPNRTRSIGLILAMHPQKNYRLLGQTLYPSAVPLAVRFLERILEIMFGGHRWQINKKLFLYSMCFCTMVITI
jgi:hypothetical protein